MKPLWYTKQKWVICIHIIVWIGLFSLPFLLRPRAEVETDTITALLKLLEYFLSNSVWVLLFYINAYFLVPRWLNQSRYVKYLLALVVFYLAISSIQAFLFQRDNNEGENFPVKWHFLISFFIFIFFTATSIAYRLIIDKNKAENWVKDKENEHLKTELSLLRSQASPHFLFNVLNNMVALARKKSDLLEPSLIKLSSLIRYTVYDTLAETVELEKEVDYLRSYIDLQKQRFGNNVSFDVTLPDITEHLQIEPMLLIPFVENAIKHGTGFIEDAAIKVHLQTHAGNLTFKVENRYNVVENEIKDKTSGIGLANVQRRLQLLYPQKHKLDISKENNRFIIQLTITLH